MKQEVNYDKWLLPDDTSTTLPSGMPCVLRYPSSTYFLRIGALPGGRLAQAAAQQTTIEVLDAEAAIRAQADIQADVEQALTGVDEDELRTFLLLADVFVEPKFSLNPQAGEIHPRRLRTEDRTFVMEWALAQMKSIKRGAPNDIESFPAESNERPVAGACSEALGQAAG